MSLAIKTDTKLADLYTEAQQVQQRIASNKASLLYMAGAKFYYRGRRRMTDMTHDEAEQIVREALDKANALKAEYADTDDPYGWYKEYSGTLATHQLRNAETALAKLDELDEQLSVLDHEMAKLDAVWAKHQWSRFFLVTSSSGHIHSSMHCSTCRPTTTYGWLPELSGSTEAEAVEQHGPALCSVCFPSAPVEWQGGKLTKAQAERAAH
jgi:uncharacterized small protein (DUF1192 family)